MRYFQGLRQYDLSGDEELLKNTVNLDQGMPYMSRRLVEAAAASRSPSDRLDESLERYCVPEWVRFLGATVDVQKARFVVQVHGYGPHGERVIVDRFNITDSMREALGGGVAQIDPAAVAEDWDVLTERVVRATYRTAVEGREMRVLHTMVDSGGEEGVTDKAYAWYRRLRAERLHGKVTLVKGSSNPLPGTAIKETWVGARNPREKGDVPLYLLDTNRLKDTVDKGLKRESPGPGYIHLPKWLTRAALEELQAEVRGANGKWTQVRKRNETFDLLAYAEALYIRLGADKIRDWNTAPPWARQQAENDQMVTREERREERESVRVAPAPMLPQVRPRRRSSVSSYVRG
jgi:phage terminase large subunit GpA-like protein